MFIRLILCADLPRLSFMATKGTARTPWTPLHSSASEFPPCSLLFSFLAAVPFFQATAPYFPCTESCFLLQGACLPARRVFCSIGSLHLPSRLLFFIPKLCHKMSLALPGGGFLFHRPVFLFVAVRRSENVSVSRLAPSSCGLSACTFFLLFFPGCWMLNCVYIFHFCYVWKCLLCVP